MGRAATHSCGASCCAARRVVLTFQQRFLGGRAANDDMPCRSRSIVGRSEPWRGRPRRAVHRTPRARRRRADRLAGALAVALAAAAGCRNRTGPLDDAELCSPRLRNAVEQERRGNFPAAIQAYRAALDEDAKLARAHLGLAFLLDQADGDRLAAIYHYRRYLELRPDTDKRPLIQERIADAEAAFAASRLRATNTTERVAALEWENSGLKSKITDLAGTVARLRATLSTVNSNLVAVRETQARQERMLARDNVVVAYVVQRGDSLASIAERVYGEPGRWRDIFEANRSRMRNELDVRTGQILILPR